MFRYKGDLITSLLVVTSFLFFIFTPGKENLGSAVQGFILALIFFGLLPLGYHFLVLKKDAASFGLGWQGAKKGWFLIIPTVLLALAGTGALYFFSPQFQAEYILPAFIEDSLSAFLFYELLLVPLLVAVYEIFFRGFVQKNWLEKYWGGYAVWAQGVLFCAFLVLTASFGWFTAPFAIFSIFSGFLVWKNGSLIQSWLANWLYLLSFDILVLFLK